MKELTNTQLQEARQHIIAANNILSRAEEDSNRKRGVLRIIAKELTVLDRALRSAYT